MNKCYPKLKYQLLTKEARAPTRGTCGSSGLDVYTPIDIEILPYDTCLIPLDIRFEIPYGWDLAVYNKSGISTKKKLSKGAELIDHDYRGTVHIHMFNHSNKLVKFNKGDKVAQLVMREVWMGELEESSDINIDTNRSENGFGSTGV